MKGLELKTIAFMEEQMSKFQSKPPSNGKALNLGLQDYNIKRKFPSFRLIQNKKEIYWVGELQPTPTSQKYRIKIIHHPYTPQVFIVDPEVVSFAPHRYSDSSLCLYHPNDNSFDGETLISDTIIPWTSEWLYFYEAWLDEGVWWGKEAPHSPLFL